jgi:hypothetical protein
MDRRKTEAIFLQDGHTVKYILDVPNKKREESWEMKDDVW